MPIEPSTLVSIVSTLVAACAVALSLRNYRRERLNQRIQTAKWKREYFQDLFKWSDASMLMLSEALHLCDLDPQKCEKGSFFDTRHNLRIKLSAQIDMGRWFFPNYAPEEHGQHKQPAFRGYRPAVLDALVFAYRAVTNLGYRDCSKNGVARNELERAKRLFTSEIQKILDPGSRDEEFRKLTCQVEVA